MNSTWYCGTVCHGNGNGRKFGYPTVNLFAITPATDFETGVYAARVRFDGTLFGAMMYVGSRPTLGLEEPVVEIHIFDFHGDLYGRKLEFQAVEYLRTEQKFGTVEALMEQLSLDEQQIRQLISEI